MKGFASDTTPGSGSFVWWGRWLQTCLLVALLLVLIDRLKLLPPLEGSPTPAATQRHLYEQQPSQARKQQY